MAEGIEGLKNKPGQGAKPIISREADEEAIREAIQNDPAEPQGSQGSLGIGQRAGSHGINFQTFFILIGARYRRIRKRPRGVPSPQLYAYKCEKLQELEKQWNEGRIEFFYGDESHGCTSGYEPSGWQFKEENVHVLSDQKFKLNFFGMIDRNSNYDGFTTTDSITATKVFEFLEGLSFRINKKTFVV